MSFLLSDNRDPVARRHAFSNLMDQWAKQLCDSPFDHCTYEWSTDMATTYNDSGLLSVYDILSLSGHRDELFSVGTDQAVDLHECGCADGVVHHMAGWAIYGEMQARIYEQDEGDFVLRSSIELCHHDIPADRDCQWCEKENIEVGNEPAKADEKLIRTAMVCMAEGRTWDGGYPDIDASIDDLMVWARSDSDAFRQQMFAILENFDEAHPTADGATCSMSRERRETLTNYSLDTYDRILSAPAE
tara:strand:+ start:499 stop:1233 length:735 start_codon:yes stop_codon:yes gene_type:complete